MDFRTLYIADLTSLIIYAVAVSAVAFGNPKLRGLRWFATFLLASLVKAALQYLRGLHPTGLLPLLATFVANEVNAFGYLAMYLGYHWFVVRKPLQNWLVPGVVFSSMAVYGISLLLHVSGAPAMASIPVFVSCVAAAHLMLNRATDQFVTAGRVTLITLLLQILISGYRTFVFTLHYTTSQINFLSLTDPRWTTSMGLLMALDTFFVGSFFWFYVVEYQSVLRHQACTDTLTGALNRRALDAEAKLEIARARRGGLPLSLLVLDIDHFKLVNDARGHEAGDLALCELVLQLLPELRSGDRLARSGGEEFLVLLPSTTLADAREVAERIRATVERMVVPYDGLPICVTVSLGVAELYPSADDSWEALRKRADEAMYAAKRRGRNRVECHADELLRTAFEGLGAQIAGVAVGAAASASLSRPPAA